MDDLALYDIHGNIDALEAVLADAEEPDVVLVEPVEAIVVTRIFEDLAAG